MDADKGSIYTQDLVVTRNVKPSDELAHSWLSHGSARKNVSRRYPRIGPKKTESIGSGVFEIRDVGEQRVSSARPRGTMVDLLQLVEQDWREAHRHAAVVRSLIEV